LKIKEDNKKSDDPLNNPVFTPDSPSTEMIKFHSLKGARKTIGKKNLAFSLVQNRTSENPCMSHNNQAFLYDLTYLSTLVKCMRDISKILSTLVKNMRDFSKMYSPWQIKSIQLGGEVYKRPPKYHNKTSNSCDTNSKI